AFKANDEEFYKLVSQAMKEMGISDSIFIPFIGSKYYADDTLMNAKEAQTRTDKDDILFYKKEFIEQMRDEEYIWSDERFREFKESDIYYYDKIQNGIATQKLIQAGLEKGLPLAQAALGVGEVIGGVTTLATCPSV
ncbi:MAG: hypothetical protein Q4C68_08470, partial [Moraxella sp.]|nr:hypothetical protein [Moraxella sp.]